MPKRKNEYNNEIVHKSGELLIPNSIVASPLSDMLPFFAIHQIQLPWCFRMNHLPLLKQNFPESILMGLFIVCLSKQHYLNCNISKNKRIHQLQLIIVIGDNYDYAVQIFTRNTVILFLCK